MKSKWIACTVVSWMTVAGVLQAADAPPAMPKPVKEHEWLRNLAGEWETDCEVCMEGQPSVKSKLTERARMLGGFWIVSDANGSLMGLPFASQFTLGYDPQTKKYIGTWVDSMTSVLWRYEGTLDASGQTMTLVSEGPSPVDHSKTTKFKDIIELTGKDQKTLTSSYLADDGQWKLCGRMTSRRKAGAADQKAQAEPGANRVVHFEIPATEPEKLAKFYGDVFGWSIMKTPVPNMEYWVVMTGNDGAGINGGILPRRKPDHGITNYVNVTSIDATIEKATKLGAKVALPKMPVPGIGFVACLVDPQGNLCGLWEQEKK